MSFHIALDWLYFLMPSQFQVPSPYERLVSTECPARCSTAMRQSSARMMLNRSEIGRPIARDLLLKHVLLFLSFFLLRSLPLTWHLTGAPSKGMHIFLGGSPRCHVSGRRGRSLGLHWEHGPRWFTEFEQVDPEVGIISHSVPLQSQCNQHRPMEVHVGTLSFQPHGSAVHQSSK